jgi:hypothetical protein
VRAHGCIHTGSGLGEDAHACWAFDGRQEFVDASIEYLADGLRCGQRLAYVGSEPVAEQRERLGALGDVGGMIDKGSMQLFQLGDLYKVGEPLDTETQLATYAAATDAALADGYTGLRVAAQVTDLVVETGCWDAHLRWESVADRFMSIRPMSALCGYRRGDVPEQFLSDLAAVHPATNQSPESVPFRVFSEDGDLVLAGEVDLFSSEALDRVLTAALQSDEPITLDLGELGFIDRHGIETLAAHTRRLAATGCDVRNSPHIVDRLCDLLDLKL